MYPLPLDLNHLQFIWFTNSECEKNFFEKKINTSYIKQSIKLKHNIKIKSQQQVMSIHKGNRETISCIIYS